MFTAVLLLLLPLALAQNNSCPGCKSAGSCVNGACVCPDGFGGQDCGDVTCGSIAMSPIARPKRNTTDCACSDGFTGPNCNICTRNSVCSSVPGIPIGSDMVCNPSPVVWKSKHQSVCTANEPLLQSIFPGQIDVSIARDISNGSAFGAIWYEKALQVTCSLKECAQEISVNTTFLCNQIKCNCVPGTKFCGGGGLFDLTGPISQASGKTLLRCPTRNSTAFDFLSALLPDGVTIDNCKFGECADKSDAPGALDNNSLNQIDTAGWIGIIVGVLLLLGLLCLYIYSWADRARRRKAPLPKFRPGSELSFTNIGYAIGKKTILRDISGVVQPGKLLSVMGPSGGGKSTLLDILAQKNKSGKRTGTVKVGGENLSPAALRSITGYVDQEDILLPSMTVRESIAFSAKLRLPESMTTAQKMKRVDEIISQLRLSHVANTRIGDSMKRGISGGEKRRVSIGIELVTNPCILFLDEPTSGLDSFSAAQVMETLESLAHDQGKTIIFTIHQPRSDIFAKFDYLLLLSKGKTLYFGPAAATSDFCRTNGFPCPEGYNIADHLLDYAQGALDGQPKVTEGDLLRHRIIPARTHTNETKTAQYETEIVVSNPSKDNNQSRQLAASFLTQLNAIMGRSYLDFCRRPGLFFTHFIASIVLGAFLGGLYYRVDNTLGGIQNRLGSLFFLQSLLGFAGLSAMTTFSREKVLFVRERSNGFYGPIPFFISKVVWDIVPLRIIPTFTMCSIAFYLIAYSTSLATYFRYITVMTVFGVNCALFCLLIGCLIDDFSTATLICAISMLFQMLFAGILVNQVAITGFLRWIQYLSMFKWAYEAAAANDASGIRLQTSLNGLQVSIPATTILQQFGIDVTAYSKDLAVSMGIGIFFLITIGLLVQFRLRESR